MLIALVSDPRCRRSPHHDEVPGRCRRPPPAPAWCASCTCSPGTGRPAACRRCRALALDAVAARVRPGARPRSSHTTTKLPAPSAATAESTGVRRVGVHLELRSQWHQRARRARQQLAQHQRRKDDRAYEHADPLPRTAMEDLSARGATSVNDFLRRAKLIDATGGIEWRRVESNHGPRDYETLALAN